MKRKWSLRLGAAVLCAVLGALFRKKAGSRTAT